MALVLAEFACMSVCADEGARTSPAAGSVTRLPPIIELSPQPTDSPAIITPAAPQPDWYSLHGVVRADYFNDQRIEWSGQEATFGVEAAVTGTVNRQFGNWQSRIYGELYFNQPFDQNIFIDGPERRSYLANFQVDTVELSQLFLESRNGDLSVALGKMATPFGRTYFPILRNDFSDGPFIRTESILWRETGLAFQWDPGAWVFTAALTNGSEDRDTNSSKALVSRVGVDLETFAIGASVKWQDGIGSEEQKIYNNHIGVDVMFRRGPITFSGEVIYDQYGFRRPVFDPNDITWPRSVYFREQNRGLKQPIQGVGYYFNVDICLERWIWMLNYGEFYPEAIGDPRHDATTRRGIVKGIRHLTPYFDMYAMALIENWLPNAQAGRTRKGIAILAGFQCSL